MKIKIATQNDEEKLLAIMQESFEGETDPSVDEWRESTTAIHTLLRDPQAGEANLIFDDDGSLIGYIIMCRGFSLDYGGYFTWVEESYIRESEQGRFRDKRFSP